MNLIPLMDYRTTPVVHFISVEFTKLSVLFFQIYEREVVISPYYPFTVQSVVLAPYFSPYIADLHLLFF